MSADGPVGRRRRRLAGMKGPLVVGFAGSPEEVNASRPESPNRRGKGGLDAALPSRLRLPVLRRGAVALRRAVPSCGVPRWLGRFRRGLPSFVAALLTVVAARAFSSRLALVRRSLPSFVAARPFSSRLALLHHGSGVFVASLLLSSRLFVFFPASPRCRSRSPEDSRLQGSRRGCRDGGAPRPWRRRLARRRADSPVVPWLWPWLPTSAGGGSRKKSARG
jgi:hypothetical protein